METTELIEYNAFNPNDYNNYQSPKRKEQNRQRIKLILVILICITIAIILKSILENREK